MSLLVFMHAASEGPSVLGRVLTDYGHKLRFVHLYAGQSVPPDLDEVDGIISMGGPMNVDQASQHAWIPAETAFIRKAHEAGLPVVGICLGAQLIAAALGGEVKAMAGRPEIGWYNVRLGFPGTIDPVLAGVPWNVMQFHLHGQEVGKLPPQAVALAGSAACKAQAFRVGLKTYAFQYHFEWDKGDIAQMLQDPFAAQGELGRQEILDAMPRHYETYRRLGDRVCANVSELLFAK